MLLSYFSATRLDTMEWIRFQHRWEALPNSDINQQLAKAMGRGKNADNDEHNNQQQEVDTQTLKARARITFGMRAQRICGGPQHQGDFLKYAENNQHSYSAHAVKEGCRGCRARGFSPGRAETNAHCFLCCSAHVGILYDWRKQVLRTLSKLYQAIKTIQPARPVLPIIQTAILGLARPHSDTENAWQAIRLLVSGILPKWEGTPPPHLDGLLESHIRALQSSFTMRLHTWSIHMASAGLKRQRGWDHNPWIHLIYFLHGITSQNGKAA